MLSDKELQQRTCKWCGYIDCESIGGCIGKQAAAATRQEMLDAGYRKVPSAEDAPKLVCLCGSTRFKDVFDNANYEETMKGNIVLTVGFFMHSSGNRHNDHIGCTPEQKIMLDKLHFRKIDLTDEVKILNVGGYIGESTQNELNYARSKGKRIIFLEPPEEQAGEEDEEEGLSKRHKIVEPFVGYVEKDQLMRNFWIKNRLETHHCWTVNKMLLTVLGCILMIVCFSPLLMTEAWWLFPICASYPAYSIIHFMITIISFVKTDGMHYDH